MFAPPPPGQSRLVQFSDIAALPVRLGSAVRGRRLFHPVGILAEGTLERLAPAGEGLPMASGDVIGRVSKGIGLPGALPDIAGLAWRMRVSDATTPWDVLLASTVRNRLLLAPAAKWWGTTFSSLMPFRHGDGVWWIRARLTTEIDVAGLPLDAIRSHLGSTGVDFLVDQAAGTGEFLPLARLTLRRPHVEDVAFDPILNTDPDVQPLPQWLADFRRAAYRRSREGRDA
ncbi:phosphodiesterase [Mycobacterium sp. 1274761.0]|uniref:phosphodiesterase n=1 Tax=Mycobacterium sp. 1274761.0 TaxID=1834077 RepID=UPI001E435C34|nr:phosphodiesterase [Mycobacterium sp. 1274761.0]